MAKTIAQLHTEAQTIRDATVTGENTATRVGGAIDDVVEYLDEVGGTFASGEVVGDVSVFDSEGDLTGKTDAQKALMIPSGRLISGIVGTLDENNTSLLHMQGYMSIQTPYTGTSAPANPLENEWWWNGTVLALYSGGSWSNVPMTGVGNYLFLVDGRICAYVPTSNNDGYMQDIATFERTEINSSSWITGSVRGAINGSTYAQYGSWDYPKFIPVQGGALVQVTTGAYRAQIAFVTNTTMSNGGAVPYATGESSVHTIAVNTTAYFYLPSDCNYIHTPQKTGENWAYPTSVIQMLDARSEYAVLSAAITTGDNALNAQKQDKQYYVDLSTATIIASRDDINSTNNDQRATLRMQRVFKGDVFRVVKVSGVGSGTMLVRTFNKGKIQIAQTGWISQYTILQDGYATVVVNSSTNNGGTTQFLLDALSQARVIESIVQEYLDLRWTKDNDEIVYNRVLQSNNRRYFQFTGESPFCQTLRWVQLKTLNPNQSMAIYNGKIFLFQKGAAFKVYDYYTFEDLGSASAILAANVCECNASWFSSEFYDPSDEYPILYSQQIYATPYIVGFRIQNTGGTWSITKVHEILFNGVSVSNLIALNQRDDRLVSLGANLITFQRPTYAASTGGVSTLTSSDVITSAPKEDALVFGQDCSMIGDICVGINNVGSPNNTLFGINVQTGKTVFTFTPPSPWGEGEGLEWYCGRLYAADVQGRFFELTFP